jgi:phosphoglycolate phosphatase
VGWLDSSQAAVPKALLFDLDGTLVDSAPDIAAALDDTLRQLQFSPVGEPAVRMWIGNGAPMLLRRALANAIDCSPEQVPQALLQAGLEAFFINYEACCCQATIAYPGVMRALEGLHAGGIAMACVTNKPVRFTIPLLAALGLQPYFPVVLGGDSLAQKKPDPAPLRAAAQGLGIVLSDCVMVGDSGTDVSAARNAGIGVVAVSYGYSRGVDAGQLGADRVVDSLLELLA